MSPQRSIRVLLAAFAACVVLALIPSGRLAVRAEGERRVASNIRVAPPAPVFDEKERLAELAQRRARVAQSIGPKSLLILFSTEPRVYTNDVDYQYRQENNLYYLTNLKQNRATLVLLPGNTQTPEILFIPKRDPAAETWTGHMYSPEEANEISGISEIWRDSEFEPLMKALRNRQPYRPKDENIFKSNLPAGTVMANGNGFEPLLESVGKNEAGLYMLMPRDPESREYKLEQRFAAEWTRTASGYSLKNAWPIFVEMRLRKSPMELRLMQHAIDISTEAHQRAWASAGNAKWEYEVDAEMAYTFKLRNADNWA
ncbi:MAG TPA: aminopeptidase P N-terminal domain-containing protein, partial [Pyrinomonadaceae bacterium]|nr:aminopeptidase P N-terminal domain-containing protein [Pyrinomonadaceae bacterium]